MAEPGTLARVRHLFEGNWTMPAELRAQYRNACRLIDTARQIAAPAYDLDAAVMAAINAKHPEQVDVSALVDHDRALREAEIRVEVLQRAVHIVTQDLVRSLTDQRDQLITGAISKAGKQIWAEIVETVAQLPDGDTAPLRGTAEQRAAYQQLSSETGLTRAYLDTRRAVELLYRLNGGDPLSPQHDVSGDHAEFECGLCAIAPRSPGAPGPWPTNQRARVIWFAHRGHTPWWPTNEQRDSAWMAAHRDAYERQQQARRQRARMYV
jgi:hypothetical protein